MIFHDKIDPLSLKTHRRVYFCLFYGQGFYEAMTILEESIVGVEGFSDGAIWGRMGAVIGVNGIYGNTCIRARRGKEFGCGVGMSLRLRRKRVRRSICKVWDKREYER
ncbi:hypothetical protein CIG75_15750 [Tumebacillus algifaecis]|uniref:Uncharacterized protein n=1 Tax=Tumebacillus algifaecis TaxID=1214604 RepID=A0A223D3R2_9BACL|nr:hypothetical protein CIG75_15750 [Tumebacillus algifaecis]